jgi:hypothetical protein
MDVDENTDMNHPPRWNMRGTPTHPKVPSIPVTEAPKWFGELQHALVDADLCDWTARSRPHPLEYAMFMLWFFETKLLGEHEHEWIEGLHDQMPYCRICNAEPKNPNYRIPIEDCACGGGLLGCKGYEHTLERCGPPTGESSNTTQ